MTEVVSLISEEKMNFLINNVGKTGYLHGKK